MVKYLPNIKGEKEKRKLKYKALLLSLLMILPIAAVAFPIDATIGGPVVWVNPSLIKKKGPCLVSSTFDVDVKLWNKEDLTGVGVYAFDIWLTWPNATYMLNASARVQCPTPAPKLSESVISLVGYEFTSPWDHYYVIAEEVFESTGLADDDYNDGFDRFHLAITALDGSDPLTEVQISLVTLTFHIDCEPLYPDKYFVPFDLEATLSDAFYKDPVTGIITIVPVVPEVDDGMLMIYVWQPDVYLAPEYFCEYKVNMPHTVEFWLSHINKAYGFGFAIKYNNTLLEADVQSIVICDAFPPPYEYLHFEVVDLQNGFSELIVEIVRPCEKPSVTHQPGPAATFSLNSIYDLWTSNHYIPICENSTITLEWAYMLAKCGCEGDGDTVTYGYNYLSDQALAIVDALGDPLNLAIEYNWRPRIGDLNLDGAVDVADLDLLAAHYGVTMALGKWGNLDNLNIVVDIFDFVILAKFFGKPYECIRDPDLTLCWPN